MEQYSIDKGEKMSDPKYSIGEDAGTSRGPSYNWCDFSTLWGGLELRMPDDETSRAYYAYLKSEAGAVMSGSAVSDYVDSNAKVVTVSYDECSTYDDLEPTPMDPDPDPEPSPSPSPSPSP